MTKLQSILITLSLTTMAVAHAQMGPGTMSMPSSQTKADAAAAMPLTEGEVQRVDKEHGEVVLKHGDLPDLGMPAMTMAFNASAPILEKLKTGDRVRFNAEIVKGEPTITHIEIVR